MILFIIVLIIPWLLDLSLNFITLKSFLGMILWGLALSLSIIYSQKGSRRWNKLSLKGTWLFSLLWLALWCYHIFSADTVFSGFNVDLTQYVAIHAIILGACGGSVLFCLFVEILINIKDRELRKKIKANKNFFLPSLETLKISIRSLLSVSLYLWSIGLFLAVLTSIYALKEEWYLVFFNLKVILTFVCWAVLAVAKWNSQNQKKIGPLSGLLPKLFVFLCLFGWLLALATGGMT